MLDIEFAVGDEGVIPLLAVALDERFLKELVKADAAFCAEVYGVLADVPAVVVEAVPAVAKPPAARASGRQARCCSLALGCKVQQKQRGKKECAS